MTTQVEFLIPAHLRNGEPILRALQSGAKVHGCSSILRRNYGGDTPWLVMYGVGHPTQAPIRKQHIDRGGRVVLLDAGYFDRPGPNGMMRVSIDHDHPQHLLDQTPEDRSRWDALHVALREDHDPAGPIILVGLGPKTRTYLWREADWEKRKLKDLQRRFPGRRIIYRPKPKRPYPGLPTETDDHTPIRELLRGASLVVCRHSNVAVDAAVAGVPVECDDGAAMWLHGKPYTPETRLAFLRRLAWWQWRPSEGVQAWAFLHKMLEAPKQGV